MYHSLAAPTGLSHRYGSSVPTYSEDGSRPTPPASGRSSPFSAYRSAEDLESQNDEQIEGLRAKVQMLKNVSKSISTRKRLDHLRLVTDLHACQVTIGIGNEVKESTVQLSQMVRRSSKCCVVSV